MKVSAVIPPTGMSVECDGYVPLVARNFGDFVYCEKYWRTGDFKDTIFEFGVESTGGAICKVTITLMNELSKAVNPSSELSTIQDGTPCFDKKCWKESARVLDDSGSPTASLVNDRLIVRFSGNASGSFRGRMSTTSSLRFGRHSSGAMARRGAFGRPEKSSYARPEGRLLRLTTIKKTFVSSR